MSSDRVILRTHPFKTFPMEWKLVISGSYRDRYHLREMIEKLIEQVKERGGKYLVNISKDHQEQLRSDLYGIGFEDYYHNINSKLDLTSYNTPTLELPHPYRIVHWNNYRREDKQDAMRELYELECSSSDDIPEREGFKHPSFIEFRDRFNRKEATIDTLFLITHLEDIVGMTYCYFDGGVPGIFYTGVNTNHRGRNLATVLKASLASHLRDEGYSELHTSNKSSNYAILKTNQKLGFEPVGKTYLLIYPF